MSERIFLVLKFQVLTRLLFWRKKLYDWLMPKAARETVMVNLGGGLFLRPHWQVLDYVSPYYPFFQLYIDENIDLLSDARVNGGAKLVHPGGAKLDHLTLCGTRCWGVVPVVHRRDPRCFE